jgi:glycosyltransferase involved in cell wall biosynthesis
MKRVFMVMNGYAPNDPSAFYTAASLVKLDYIVTLLGTARQQDNAVATYQILEGVSIRIVPHVVGFAWRAVWQWLTANIGQTISANRARTTLWSFLFFNLWVLRVGLGMRVDVVHCHDLSPLPACWLLARLKGAKVVYHAREDFPTRYRGKRAQQIERMERWLLPRMDAVISAGIRLQTVLMQRGARDVVWIGNWKRLEEYAIAPQVVITKRAEYGLAPDDTLIVYIGTLDPARELMPLLRVLQVRHDVHLWIGGQGILHDEIRAIATNTPNMRWLGWVNLCDVPLLTLCADALYCVLDTQEYGNENQYCPAANKLFESYAAAVPLIALKNVNEMADLIAQSDSGILIDDASPAQLNQAFDQLKSPRIHAIKQNAQQAGTKYNWDVAEAKLKEIYERL